MVPAFHDTYPTELVLALGFSRDDGDMPRTQNRYGTEPLLFNAVSVGSATTEHGLNGHLTLCGIPVGETHPLRRRWTLDGPSECEACRRGFAALRDELSPRREHYLDRDFLKRGPGYRRPVEPGTYFSFTFADVDRSVAGRVIRSDVQMSGLTRPLYLIYLYSTPLPRAVPPLADLERWLTVRNLLGAPAITTRSGWWQGYFRVLGHKHLRSSDVLKRHCFWTGDGYCDADGNPVRAPRGECGSYGISGYNAVGIKAFSALGLRLPDGRTASHIVADQSSEAHVRGRS